MVQRCIWFKDEPRPNSTVSNLFYHGDTAYRVGCMSESPTLVLYSNKLWWASIGSPAVALSLNHWFQYSPLSLRIQQMFFTCPSLFKLRLASFALTQSEYLLISHIAHNATIDTHTGTGFWENLPLKEHLHVYMTLYVSCPQCAHAQCQKNPLANLAHIYNRVL